MAINFKYRNIKIMSTKKFTWCEKSSALAAKLYADNKAKQGIEENSQKALTEIAKQIVDHVQHKGTPPTFHGVRSKLSSMGTYVPSVAKPSNKGGNTESKADIVEKLKNVLGIDFDVGTLSNANRVDLELVAEKATKFDIALKEANENHVDNASREQLEQALANLQDAEQDAIASGFSPSDIAEVEQAAAEAVENS